MLENDGLYSVDVGKHQVDPGAGRALQNVLVLADSISSRAKLVEPSRSRESWFMMILTGRI